MRVRSFVRKGIDLEVVDIEVSLVPGLPTIQLIGLPDVAIKESILRIKSALRHQGFHLPQREQVLVHLKPSHEKKSSQGLDLAIVAAYLAKTRQIEIASGVDIENFVFYGEVSLEGEVIAPSDIELIETMPEGMTLVTGATESRLDICYGRAGSLKDLANVVWVEPNFSSQPPPNLGIASFSELRFAEAQAELMTVVATGEHNAFVAGPAGTGKTTFSEVVHALLREPTSEERKKIDKIARITGGPGNGRPFVSPHHSSTDIALLGGGVPPYPGEITRAQHGVLVLDEFLEFRHHVKESLREPIEKHEITVCRAGAHVTFPADFLLIGTSNLCPCGEYVPNRPVNCGYSKARCHSYYQRLSGPLLDRFEIVSFSHVWKSRHKHSAAELRERVLAAQAFALKSRNQAKVNSRLSLSECEVTIPAFVRGHLLPELPTSHRRRLALYRVARTFADLEGQPEVSGRHIEKAKNLTIQPFREMKEACR